MLRFTFDQFCCIAVAENSLAGCVTNSPNLPLVAQRYSSSRLNNLLSISCVNLGKLVCGQNLTLYHRGV